MDRTPVRPLALLARLVTSLALLAATVTVGPAAAAEGDTTPPVVVDLRDVSGLVRDDGRIEIRGHVTVTDDASGIERVLVGIRRASGRQANAHLTDAVVLPPFSGRTTLDEPFDVDLADERASTFVLRVTAFDTAGNVTVVDTAELEARGLDHLVTIDRPEPTPSPEPTTPTPSASPGPDTTPPTLDGLTMAEPERRVDGLGRTVVTLRGTVAASDVGDGLERVVVSVYDRDGDGLGSGTVRPVRSGAGTMDGPVTVQVTRPEARDSFPTTGLLRVTAFDVAGNVVTWDTGTLEGRGLPAVLDLRGPQPEPDPTPSPTATDDPDVVQPGAQPDPDATPRSTASARTVLRIAGEDRAATAYAVARAGWPGGAAHAVLATGRDFPDALAAGPLAALVDGPVLLDDRDVTRTVARLTDLGVREVTVVGGEAAVSAARVAELGAAGFVVRRLAGRDRFATAAVVAEEWSDVTTVWVASGAAAADALAAGAAAAIRDEPVLLTRGTSLPPATVLALTRLEPDRIVLVGGPAAVDDGVARALAGLAPVVRAAGTDRHATAVAVARVVGAAPDGPPLTSGIGSTRVLLATGRGFADAVTAAGLAARGLGPLLLTGTTLPEVTRAALDEQTDLVEVRVLGGPGAVPDAVVAALLR